MFHNSWDIVLKDEMEKQYFKYIKEFVKEERLSKTIYPPAKDLFNAFKLTDFNDIKVVILGQDPYHGENEANGLSFSVNEGIKLPPSLKNIYKELYDDLGITKTTGDLISWANQGVLLLNSVLTVLKDIPTSHSKIGWQEYTDAIIKKLNEREKPIVFILWGNYARSKKNLITNKRHYIIESPHPSPFSVNSGFFGSRPFSKTNEFLKKNNIKEIEW